MALEVNEDLFKELWPYIVDENVTDIKWNGSNLWITDLNKGRYLEDSVRLDEEWLKIFTNIIANSVNENFNISKPTLMAETDELRIQAEHGSIMGDKKTCLAIRKTPSFNRLANKDLIKEGYADKFIMELLPCMIRARLSGIITGDVGAGKTELEKYLCSFIPLNDPIVTVEDTLELKLKKILPGRDVVTIKVSDNFTQEDAIKDALRLNTKWLIISESRGRDIARIMEGASSGCVALTSIHAENVWEMPDRIMNMIGSTTMAGLENDIYTFFDYAIKVKAVYSNTGVKRQIDQICLFERENKQNKITIIVKNGRPTGELLPKRIMDKFYENKEVSFLKTYVETLKTFKKDNTNENKQTSGTK